MRAPLERAPREDRSIRDRIGEMERSENGRERGGGGGEVPLSPLTLSARSLEQFLTQLNSLTRRALIGQSNFAISLAGIVTSDPARRSRNVSYPSPGKTRVTAGLFIVASVFVASE